MSVVRRRGIHPGTVHRRVRRYWRRAQRRAAGVPLRTVVPHVHHECRRSRDVLRISSLENVCDAKRWFLHRIHCEAPCAVRGPKAKIGCVKRVEPGCVHPGGCNAPSRFSVEGRKRQTCKEAKGIGEVSVLLVQVPKSLSQL